jgi:hypothetical protein
MKLTEIKARELAIAISDELYGDVQPREVRKIMNVLEKFHLVKEDKLAHYEVKGQMDLVTDFPEYCPGGEEFAAEADGRGL